ncbi:MAG: flagellar type III secretion system pore protein FliP [Spirochaetaceae bacterium]|jgi:flagellar biosynthetic protein FliP|nr:flagellar type III secretion system pore protein FliP [Spirochaetaceae bacterium]
MKKVFLIVSVFLFFSMALTAQQFPDIPFIDLSVNGAQNNQDVALSLQLLLLLTLLSLAPSILVLTTSFLRIAIVLDFVKRALNLQQVPPSSVLMGIALFVSVFIMWPTFDRIYQEAYQPFVAEEIDSQEFYGRAIKPLRFFMYQQVKSSPDNIALFMNMAGLGQPETFADVPSYVLIPAYVLNELTTAFKIGILIYLPFIIIDMIVASILMSMGMIMLPPVMISTPFKLILFVLVDGWSLLLGQLVESFVR